MKSFTHLQVLLIAAAVLLAAPLYAGMPTPVFRCEWDNKDDFIGRAKWVEGKQGGGIYCGGFGNGITLNSVPGLNWRRGTVSFWMKPTWFGNSANGNPLRLVSANDKMELTFGISGSSKTMRIKLKGDEQTLFMNSLGIAPWMPDEWVCLTYTWDTEIARIYVNGRLDSSAANTAPQVPRPEKAAGVWELGQGTESVFDYARIYDQCLSAEQVMSLYREQADVAVRILLPERLPRILHPDEKLQVKIANFSNWPRCLTWSYRITDLSRPEFKQKKAGESDLVLKPHEESIQAVYVPAEEESPFGLFELTTVLRESDAELARQTRCFGAAVEPVDLAEVSPEAVFGLWNHDNACSIRGFPRWSYDPFSQVGHKWHRIDFLWKKIEPQKGSFDWEWTDKVVASARKNHVRLMPCLISTPRWAMDVPDEIYATLRQNCGGPHVMPEETGDWEKFVLQVVNRYKDTIKHWEIWNEPYEKLRYWDYEKKRWDVGEVKGSNYYYELVKHASIAAKRADPDAKIVSEPMFHEFRDALMSYEDGDYHKKYVDIIARHYYYQGGYPEVTIGAIQADREYYRKKIGAQPIIWDTEGGKCIPNRLTNRPMTAEEIERKLRDNPRAPGYWWMHPAVSEWQQAAEVSRDYLVKWGEGIDKVFTGNYGDYNQGPNVCSWRDGVPVVSCLASIHQIQLLHDAEFVRKVVSTGNIYAYLFRKKYGSGIGGAPEYILACWTTVGKDQIRLQTGASEVTRLDLFGNPQTISTREGDVDVELSERPVYLGGVKADVRLLPPRFTVACDSNVIGAGSIFNLTMTVTNVASAREMRGAIHLELPEGWQSDSSRIPVACPPGVSREVRGEVRVPPATADGAYNLLVRWRDAQSGAESRQRLTFTVKNTITCFYMNEAPRIDGNLYEWQNLPSLKLDQREQVKIGLALEELKVIQPFLDHRDIWQGVGDLSGDVRIAWDDENLYVAAFVRDNDILHRKRFSKPLLRDGDCLELFLDIAVLEKSPWSSGRIQNLCFVPPDAEFKQATWGPRKGIYTIRRIDVSSARTTDGYTLEIALPWSNFPGFKPAPGTELDMDVAINDADANYKDGLKIKNKLVFHGTRQNTNTARDYSRIRLAK